MARTCRGILGAAGRVAGLPRVPEKDPLVLICEVRRERSELILVDLQTETPAPPAVLYQSCSLLTMGRKGRSGGGVSSQQTMPSAPPAQSAASTDSSSQPAEPPSKAADGATRVATASQQPADAAREAGGFSLAFEICFMLALFSMIVLQNFNMHRLVGCFLACDAIPKRQHRTQPQDPARLTSPFHLTPGLQQFEKYNVPHIAFTGLLFTARITWKQIIPVVPPPRYCLRSFEPWRLPGVSMLYLFCV